MQSIRKTVQAILIVSVLSARATAQMPGTPVLQNAFANPGLTAGLDIANLEGASSYALAAAWAPGVGRFQLSGGVGLQTRKSESNRTIYGARVNVPMMGSTGSLGISLFAGYGGLSGGTNDSTVVRSLVPVGATLGYRRAFGTARGISIYGSPVYEWVTRGGGASGVSVFRGDIGLDIGVTSAIGVTLGIEFGGKQTEDSGRPSGTAFGAAISYAIGAGR